MKILKCTFLAVLGINLYLLLTGIVLPKLISTDQLPLAIIVFCVSVMLVGSVSVICWYVNKENKK